MNDNLASIEDHAALIREEALSNSISIAQQSVWWMEREHGPGQ